MSWVTVSCAKCGCKVSYFGSWDMPLDVLCEKCAKERKKGR